MVMNRHCPANVYMLIVLNVQVQSCVRVVVIDLKPFTKNNLFGYIQGHRRTILTKPTGIASERR